MKKHSIIFVKIFLSLTILNSKIKAQDTNPFSSQNFKMGIVLGTGLNIGNVTNSTIIKNNGLGTNFSIGMILQKTINQNLSFNTGIEFDFDNFSYTSQYQNGDSIYYYFAKSESKILSKEEYDEPNNSDYYKFTMENREFNTIYLTVPTMLTGRTNMIGKNSYFARIGLRHSFLIKDIINDNGRFEGKNQKTALDGLTSDNELSFYKLNLGLSVGTEWNFIGNSFVVFEMGYYVGLTNIHQGESVFGDDKQKDMSLILGNSTPSKYTTVKGTQNQLLLKATFLF
jgi:hypothetical protein